jgi:hypothetical protein
MEKGIRLADPFTGSRRFDQPRGREAGLSAALRQNASSAARRKFPSARHAGNEIDRKTFGCKLYFEFWRLCLSRIAAYMRETL